MGRARIHDSIQLQERDIAVLRGLFESRVMTLEHVSVLYFAGHSEAAKKRLQKIKVTGLIAERPRRTFEPAVLYLTRQGIALLHERGILREYPAFGLPALERRARVSDATIRHELDVMDAKAALCSAIRTTDTLSVVEFTTWPILIQFETDRKLVKPDGFVRLRESKLDGLIAEHCFFLEIDRSTETHETLVSRIACYVDHYKSGGFAERHGALRSAYKLYPFRVLVILKSVERRNNLAGRLLAEKTPALTQTWLTTLQDLKNAPLGPIWIRPADLRESTSGSAFAQNVRGPRPGYGHRLARNPRMRMHRLLS